MDVKTEFAHLYRRKRNAGFSPGRAHRSALNSIFENVMIWSNENKKAITSEQLEAIEAIKKDETFLQVLEDTLDMSPEQLDLYNSYRRPRLSLVK